MSNLYVTRLKKQISMENGFNTQKYENINNFILVYEKSQKYYIVYVSDCGNKTIDEVLTCYQIYIDKKELIPLDVFLKEYGIQFENNLNLKKIQKIFNPKHTIYISKINKSKIIELDDFGIAIRSEPINWVMVYKNKNKFYDCETNKSYITFDEVNDVEQEYISTKTELFTFIGEKFDNCLEKIKKLT